MSSQEFLKDDIVVNVCILILLLIGRAGEDRWQFLFLWIRDRCRWHEYSRYKKHSLVNAIFTNIH